MKRQTLLAKSEDTSQYLSAEVFCTYRFVVDGRFPCEREGIAGDTAASTDVERVVL